MSTDDAYDIEVDMSDNATIRHHDNKNDGTTNQCDHNFAYSIIRNLIFLNNCKPSYIHKPSSTHTNFIRTAIQHKLKTQFRVSNLHVSEVHSSPERNSTIQLVDSQIRTELTVL